MGREMILRCVHPNCIWNHELYDQGHMRHMIRGKVTDVLGGISRCAQKSGCILESTVQCVQYAASDCYQGTYRGHTRPSFGQSPTRPRRGLCR